MKARPFSETGRKSGFTLTEVLVSTIIIAIVSIGSYAGFYVLSGAAEASRNQLHAISLAQGTMEEARALAKISYDTLSSANFPDNIDQARYPGFHRLVTVTNDPATIELKRIDASVSWTERGRPKQYNLALLLSRPPEPLPANIHGTVTNSLTTLPVDNAGVDLTFVSQPALVATTTTARNCFYTFVDSAGNPWLKPGNWNLRVTRDGYYIFQTVVQNLDSGEDRTVDIAFNPKPDPAHIIGRTVDITAGNTPISICLYLREGGNHKASLWSGGAFSFEIKFENANPRSFTIATDPYWMMNRGYCGNFPDCSGWGKSYNYMGWSSSVVRADGTYQLGNPWYGNTPTDRLTVNPGDTLDMGDIPFVPIPSATLQGYIYDHKGNPVPGTVYTNWHNNYSSPYGSTHSSDSSGFYQITVPAEQELFPDQQAYYLYVLAKGNVAIEGSCGLPGSSSQDSNKGWERVGPLYAGDVLDHDFKLKNAPNTEYGNATGDVADGKTSALLGGANVYIWGWKLTDASGVYDFSCTPAQTAAGFFMIPIGQYNVQATRSGYYTFNSAGNSYYSTRPNIRIKTKQTATYETIRLWPAVYGGIVTGRVMESGVDGGPIPGATVKLRGPQNKDTATGGNGIFTFSNLLETWPPSGMGPADPYYKHNPINYYILEVRSTDAYEVYGPTPATIILDQTNGYSVDLGDITLRKKGQF
jgi:prepilin-type N-terminal cleavage/methylation domain-containing protein